MYEVIIIGAGPAGAAAAIYAARKKLKALLITESIGGQSVVSDSIENWIGEVQISGVELAKKLENHIRATKGIDIKLGEKVQKVVLKQDDEFPVYTVITDKGEYDTYSLIVASGGRRRHLNVPGEEQYIGKGVAFCTTCDAPIFKDKKVVVVGGGNAALEGVIDLKPYAKYIYILNKGESLKGDEQTQEFVLKMDNVEIHNNVEIVEIYGNTLLKGVKYKDLNTGEIKDLQVDGVFVEIGSVPNSEIVADLVELNERNEIKVDHVTFKTSRKGIFAAGDVTDQIYKQNNVSVGNGISALLTCYDYIRNLRKVKKE